MRKVATSFKPMEVGAGKRGCCAMRLAREGDKVASAPANRDSARRCSSRGALLFGALGQGVHCRADPGSVGQPAYVRQDCLGGEAPRMG